MIDRDLGRLAIETERVRLRMFEPHDLEPLHRLWNDPVVMKFIRPGWAPTREHVEKYFEKIRTRWLEDGFSHFALTLKNSDELIGYCGFQYLEKSPEIELLYGLASDYWGRGYITEAASACLEFAYKNTELDRIVAIAYPQNKRSWRVMEKVGMKFEKIIEENNEDLVCYVITRDCQVNPRPIQNQDR